MTPPKEEQDENRATRLKTVAQQKINSGAASARAATRKAGESFEAYPIAAMAGGLALGVVLGALLPRIRQEEQLLGSLGEKLTERANDAVSAARDAGRTKLEELGLSSDAAGKQVGKLVESVVQVVESAGSAAVRAARR